VLNQYEDKVYAPMLDLTARSVQYGYLSPIGINFEKLDRQIDRKFLIKSDAGGTMAGSAVGLDPDLCVNQIRDGSLFRGIDQNAAFRLQSRGKIFAHES
jgi:hypothetical protein